MQRPLKISCSDPGSDVIFKRERINEAAEDLRIVIPMVGSVLLYLAGLGFMAGILVRRAISLKVRC
jgi:hypothetical protein